MDIETAKNVFPCYKDNNGKVLFDINNLPPEATMKHIENVYRFCLWGKIDKKAFQCTYLTKEEICCKDLDYDNYGTFSTSCYGKLRDVKKKFICFTRHEPEAIVAIGTITPESGYSCEDKLLRDTKSSHIHWWIFEDASPWESFKKFDIPDK